MLRPILTYGLIAGSIVVLPMFAYFLLAEPEISDHSAFFGYATMLIALSTIFIAVKGYRDKALGGVIKFVPALLMGLGISVVAGLVYVIGWEIYMALTNYKFATAYGDAMVEAARVKGAPPAEVEQISAEMAAFAAQYANPLFRIPITFIEIFPVGVVVSLISAALLRNSRFLPARVVSA
jgi:hypothetical protein